jgi:hypothetical protein
LQKLQKLITQQSQAALLIKGIGIRMFELVKKTINRLISSSVDTSLVDSESWNIVNGSYQVKEKTINEKIKVNGQAILGKNLIIKEMMVVNGQLQASGATFESQLRTNGKSTFTECTLLGSSHFSGNLKAADSHFLSDIILVANESTFLNCQINNVVVRSLPYVKSQTVYLSAGSVVTGDIIFEAGRGEVHMDKLSQVKGTIKGGKIIQYK